MFVWMPEKTETTHSSVEGRSNPQILAHARIHKHTFITRTHLPSNFGPVSISALEPCLCLPSARRVRMCVIEHRDNLELRPSVCSPTNTHTDSHKYTHARARAHFLLSSMLGLVGVDAVLRLVGRGHIICL